MPSALTRRHALALLAATLPGAAFAQSEAGAEAGAQTEAQPDAQDEAGGIAVVERVMGEEDAPVTLIEYASLTCPHCATFHQDVLPRLKTEFIETGKVRMIFREAYFDRSGLWASMVARCAPEDRYFGILDLIFRRQREWATAPSAAEITERLFDIGRLAGMSTETMASCLQDREKAEALVAWYQANAGRDNIRATPSFLVNGRAVSNIGYDGIAAEINAALDGS